MPHSNGTYNLKPHLRYWQKKFNLRDFELEINWVDEEGMRKFFLEDSPEDDASATAKEAVASTSADGPHGENRSLLANRHIKMVFKKGAFESEREAVAALVHEMIHNLLWPLAPSRHNKLACIHEEQIVLTLENVIFDLAYPEKE